MRWGGSCNSETLDAATLVHSLLCLWWSTATGSSRRRRIWPSGARICTTGPVRFDGGAFLCPGLLGVRAEMALPLHVIASLGCRRWRCHSVQDHRRKIATMTPMGVMSLPEGIAEVFLHCMPCPCCSTSHRSRISGRRGCPRKGRGGDDGVANQWRLPVFIATTMAAVFHAF
jgi:hypothetical protein